MFSPMNWNEQNQINLKQLQKLVLVTVFFHVKHKTQVEYVKKIIEGHIKETTTNNYFVF